MSKLTSLALALAVAATGFGATLSSADAASMSQRQRYVQRYCASHPRDADCRDFRRDARRWDERRYSRFARDHRDIRGDNTAAAIFGLTAGALIGSALVNGGGGSSDRGHIKRCAARYKSYDAGSDTYNAGGGKRRVCNL